MSPRARSVPFAPLAACGGGSAAEAGYAEDPTKPDVGAPDAAFDATYDAGKKDAGAKLDAGDEADADTGGAPYPIVLAHGFFGFNDFAGAGFLSYFYKVKDHLAAQGETLVFTPTVDPFNSSDYRAAQLASAIHDILQQTGKKKVVIVGHSQGGLDARVVAHDHPGEVAAVITVATPHAGSPVADAVLGAAPGPISQSVLNGLGQLLGGTINTSTSGSDSVITALAQFSSKQIPAFNAANPDVPGIPYYSIAGRSFWSDGGGQCKPDVAQPWIEKWNGNLDPCNAALALLAVAMTGTINDGLVPLASAKHGTFLGCLPADHLDEIGQILGQPPGLGNSFDYLDFWTSLAHWIRAQGY